jgi:hypothetical protein
MPETLHVKNVGPIATWPFAWTIVKAFVIGDMWVHDRAKKCVHILKLKNEVKPKLKMKILHLYENLMTRTHSSSKNLRTGQH